MTDCSMLKLGNKAFSHGLRACLARLFGSCWPNVTVSLLTRLTESNDGDVVGQLQNKDTKLQAYLVLTELVFVQKNTCQKFARSSVIK